MFNRTGITKESVLNTKQILADVNFQSSVGIVVAQAAATEVNGRKIVKAGTMLKGDLKKRTTAFTKATGSTDAVGVLLHDVDVTNSTKGGNGTLLIAGVVNVDRVDADVKATLTKDFGMIKFIAD